MKKIIIIAVAAIVLLGGGAGAAVLMMKPEPIPLTPEEEAALAEAARAAADPIYLSLNPKFTITYNTGSGMRFLQVEIDVMSFEQEAIDKVFHNMSAVRNDVILLLSGQEFSSLASVEGKESLRAAVLERVQQSARTETPLESVFFTTFIMQ